MNINRKNIPEPSSKCSFSLPKIEEFKTGNSFNVIFVRKVNLPIIRFSYLSEIGSRIDPENQKGLANLFGMVLDEGAGGLSAIELKEEFQLLGTNFSVNINKDFSSLSFLSLKENFEKSLELVSLILNKPEFEEQSFKREKGKILTSLQQVKDSADVIADLAFNNLIFDRKIPYAFPTAGYPDQINNLTINDVTAFYSNFFKKSRPYLIAVGDFEKETLVKIIDDKLAHVKDNIELNNFQGKQISKNTSIFFVDKKDSVQSEIRIGHVTARRNENDFYSKVILNSILGGQFTSRLNHNLREEKGYTYGVHSSFSYYKYAGTFYVTTSVATDYTAPAISEIMKELNKIQEGVNEEELNFAKSSIIKRFPANFETYGQIAGNLSSKIKHSLPNNYFDNYLSRIAEVTSEDITDTALKNLSPDNAVIIVVGDKQKILPQLKELKLGDITEVGIFGEEL